MTSQKLPAELIAKAKELESPEEMLEFAKSEGVELTDEEIEGVSGGWDPTDGCEESGDPDYR